MKNFKTNLIENNLEMKISFLYGIFFYIEKWCYQLKTLPNLCSKKYEIHYTK